MTTTIDLTPEQRQEILETNRQQALLVATANQPNAISTTNFVFFAAFDGTNNDLFNRPQTTNVAQLAAQVRSANDSKVFPQYYAGPGTKGTLTFSDWLGPQVTRQVTKKAKEAFEDFTDQARSWFRSDPTAPITVALASFSRGNASAAIFTQLLYANGLVASDGRVLLAPGQIPVSAGVVFDPVLTGVVGNMAFAPNVDNVVDILARDEYRHLFKAADYRDQPEIVAIIPMFGSHTDIGGGYDNGVGALSLEAAVHFFQRSGLAIDVVPLDRQYTGPMVLHSEGDRIQWTEYASFQSIDLNQNPRRFQSVATPATLTTLLGRPAKTLLLFDGRTITISETDSSGIEKVKIVSSLASAMERTDLDTYRIGANSTALLSKIETKRNNNTSTQRIEAGNFDGGSLDINVPTARLTHLAITGVEGSDRNGSVILGEDPAGFRIEGGKFERAGTSSISTWRDTDNGVTYTLLGGTLDDGKGDLIVSGAPLGGSGNKLTIENFVDGKLGISFEDKQQIEVTSSSADLTEGGQSIVTVKSDSVDDEARHVKVVASNFSSELGAIVEGQFRSFASGELDLILPAGQSELKFSVLQQGDIDAAGSLSLTATLLSADGTAVTDTATLTVDAIVEKTGTPDTTRDIVGGFSTLADDLGNYTGGDFDPNRDDILKDSAGNDHVMPGGGNDLIVATRGGDDWIEMGTGGDVGDAGPGDDLVAGQDGVDFLFGGADDDRVFADQVADSDAAIATGATAADAGADGDFLNGNEGRDLLVGNDQANILEGGSGDDRLIAGGGNDTIEADGDIRGITVDLAFTVTASSATDADGSAVGTVTIAGAANRFAVDTPGNDVVHAGGGSDFVFTGGGNDVAYGEDGVDYVFGEEGDDALFGGDGNDVLSGDNGGSALDYSVHGADFLDGGAGNDKLFGDGSADALYGGEGNDTLIGDSSRVDAGDDYLSGGAGDDELQGGMGEDMLLGGDGVDTLVGDNGGTDPSGDADFLDGGAGDDTLVGQGGDDILLGGSGSDFLQGDDGADTLDGGDGVDTLLGGVGEDTLEGGDGNDIIAGDKGGTEESGDADFLNGGAGDDTLAGQGGDDIVIGGDGADTADGGNGADFLEGDAGDDTLQGGAGDDWLDGGDGNDTALGGEGQDAISGGAGNDILVGDNGVTDAAGDADFIEGGAGDDSVFGQAGDDMLVGDDGNDLVDGGDGNDTLEGKSGDDQLAGRAGDDVLDGGDGNDWLDGGPGNDILTGGEGADVYSYDFRDGGVDYLDDIGSNTLFLHGIDPASLHMGLGSLVLRGGDAANQIHLESFDADDVAAGAGVDLFVFDNGTALSYEELLALGIDIDGTPDAEVIEGTNGKDSIDALEGDDYVIAKAGDDTVTAGEGADIVLGDLGNDTLYGGSGDDQLFGEDGNDTLDGGEGTDLLVGGAGDDTYRADTLDHVVEDANSGTDTAQANVDYTLPDNVEKLVLLGADNLSGTGNALDNIISGNSGDNVLFGLDGHDVIEGGGGADTLDGGAGNDTLRLTAGAASLDGTLLGGEGDDDLTGSAGEDLLDGGAGADAMRGGSGNDVYIVDDGGDEVVEQDLWFRTGGSSTVIRMGHDTVESFVTFALPDFVEDLVLTGSADVDGTGNAERNRLEGNEGANELISTRLDGLNDNLVSGLGAVLYLGPLPTGLDERLWDRALARYFEGEFSSNDLGAVGNIIELGARTGDTLIGNGGDDRLIGGWDDDQLDGGVGSDFLVGSGGHDVMAGGEGNDTYLVDGGFDYDFGYGNSAFVRYQDDAADEVLENPGAGTDSVYSNVEEYWLGENLENLKLLDASDLPALGLRTDDGLVSRTAALRGYGNALDNVLAGNRFNNELYGAEGSDTILAGGGDDYLDGGAGADSMAGGAGDDSYFVDDAGDLVVEGTLSGHDVVDSNIDYTLTANVEDLYLDGETYFEDLSGTGNELDNAIYGNSAVNVLSGLGGSDYLYGGEGDDTLYGGEGDDELQGSLGADFMSGGTGDDLYLVDDEGDTTLENADGGHDVVYSTITHALGANLEDLELQNIDEFGNFVGAIDGTGNELNNRITGNDSDNLLSGLGGDDALYGGRGWDTLYGDDGKDILDGGEENDILIGGDGDDVYVADSYDDFVVEAPGGGTDEVRSSDSFGLPDHVENLTLLGEYGDGGAFAAPLQGYGNALDNIVVGNDGFNTLEGNGGNDRVDGGAGSDDIAGGEGDDDLYGGDDAIFFGSSYNRPFGEDGRPIKEPNGYEIVQILASNSDFVYGGAGSDRVDGGSGDDWLYGEDGNDVLYGGDDGLSIDAGRGFVDSDGEEGGGWVEENGRLFLTNNDRLYGGSGEDTLDGGSGNDDLDGGLGLDFMAGGSGDDTYYLDGTFAIELRDVLDDCGGIVAGVPTRVWTTDAVLEGAAEGNDRIFAAAEIALPDNVEALILQEGANLDSAAGNASDNAIFGNSNDNRLLGNAGNDSLYGGLGNDVLDGGAGDDVLYGDFGDDVYNFSVGGGRDVVYSYGDGFDVVHIGSGTTAHDLTLSTNGSDVTVGINGTVDRITLAGWFDTPSSRVRAVQLCDGAMLGEADIAALALEHTITASDDFAWVLEDESAATGNVLANDSSDGGALTVANPGLYAGQFGTLVTHADGSYAYTPDHAQWLAEGESRTDYFVYEAQDEGNAHDTATIAIGVIGQDDAPQFTADPQAGHVTEDQSFTETREFANELLSGDFESFDLYEGWNVEWDAGDIGVTEGLFGGTAYFGSVGATSLISEDVSTSEGEALFVRFRVRGGAFHDAALAVRWNGETLVALENEVLGDYSDYAYEVSGIDGTSRLEIEARNDPDYWYLDDVEVVPFERFDAVPNFQTTAGTLQFEDIDASDSHSLVSVIPHGEGYLGEFIASIRQDSTLGQTGTVQWSFQAANEDLQFLSDGETLAQVYDVTLSDAFGATATRSVSVLLHGANDEPFAEDDEAFVEEDHAPETSGNVLVNDSDVDASDTLSIANAGTYQGQYGTLVLAADGSYTYTLDSAAVDFLSHGDGLEEGFDYSIVDNALINPLSAGGKLKVLIGGANDAPATQTDKAVVSEDGALEVSGNVLANDSDPDDGTVLTVANPGVYSLGLPSSYGTLHIGADGSYSFVLDNAPVQSLGAGQSAHVFFLYQADDRDVADFPVLPNNVTIGTLDIEIQGANDAPVAADDAATVAEDGVSIATGNVLANDSDVDANIRLVVVAPDTYASAYGTLVLNADGSYLYTLARDSAAVQALRAGGAVQDLFAYEASDGFATSAAILRIDIAGANDAPVTVDDAGAVSEDGVLSTSGNVLANDSDADAQTVLTVANAGTYGSLVLAEDGSYAYTLDNDSSGVQALAQGQTATDSFTYFASDGFATTPGLLTVTIAGANDAPAAAGDAAAVTEDAPPIASGNLLANDHDIDGGTVLSTERRSFEGVYGVLEVSEDGTYAYTLDNTRSTVQSLAQGQTVSEIFAYAASDGLAVSYADLTVTITGVNDTPFVANPIADQSAQAAAPFTFTFAADTFSDIDQGDVLQYSASLADGSALPGGLTFDAASRTFTATPPNHCDEDSLALRVAATDSWGASAFDDFTVTIAGGTGSGQRIVGTEADDMLSGTPCDDVIDGGKGYDVMAGGEGKDVYYVDMTCSPQGKGNEGVGNGEDPPPPGHDHDINDGPGTSPGHPGIKGGHHGGPGSECDPAPCKVDLVVEQADAGYDTVYSSATYTLPQNVEELRLLGTTDLDGTGNSLDNLLAGNSGDNVLAGGFGADTYLHALQGGDDVIDDAGGDADTLALGAGITADMVTLKRRSGDLVVDIAGARDSVTIKGWFSSEAKRIESIRFVDGTILRADDIEETVRPETGCLPPPQPPAGSGDHDGNEHHGSERRGHARSKDDDRGGSEDALDRWLRRAPKFDFARAFQDERRMEEQWVAAQWQRVAEHGEILAMLDGDGRDDGWLARSESRLFARHAEAAGAFGFEGSTGAPRVGQGLQAFRGLDEGFERL